MRVSFQGASDEIRIIKNATFNRFERIMSSEPLEIRPTLLYSDMKQLSNDPKF